MLYGCGVSMDKYSNHNRFHLCSSHSGNRVEYPYPNDKVTVQYSMFSIDKGTVTIYTVSFPFPSDFVSVSLISTLTFSALELIESYKHEVIDLSSSECIAGMKNGILSMSINQHCKLWIPRRLTAYQREDLTFDHHDTDLLIDVTLLNIIRSDVYKDTTYSNDIIFNAQKPRRGRANTVSIQHPPLPQSRKSIDLDDQSECRSMFRDIWSFWTGCDSVDRSLQYIFCVVSPSDLTPI